jgi:hypothetical protein
VTTKLPLLERLGKKCDETVLRHTAILGLQVEFHLTFTAPAPSTHASSSFKTPSINSDPYDSQHRLTLLCCNYFEQLTFLLQYAGCQNSAVSIATRYGLNGPGIESQCI